jgi:hypothetical protein
MRGAVLLTARVFDSYRPVWEGTMFLRGLKAWLGLEDYAVAKQKATEDIVARFSRGNVAIQIGSFLDSDNLTQLSESGDEAMARLHQLIPDDRIG